MARGNAGVGHKRYRGDSEYGPSSGHPEATGVYEGVPEAVSGGSSGEAGGESDGGVYGVLAVEGDRRIGRWGRIRREE